MAVSWPTTLPQHTLQDSFQYNPTSGVIRTDMEAGYPKIRRRFTATVTSYDITMVMTTAQVVIFETFFRDSLKYGTVRVNFPNPLDPNLTLAEFRWVSEGSPYQIMPRESTIDWTVSFRLERLP